MTINDWDISEANAKQWNVTPGNHSVSNDSDWVRGSPVPVVLRNEIGFKQISVTMLVYGGSREEILANRSEILSHLLEPAELVLDDFSHKFYGIMTKHNGEEVVRNRWGKLTIEFSCYEYADRDPSTFSGSTTILLENAGNIVTPVRVEITPQIGAASIELSGICLDPYTGKDLPVTIKDLVTGETVVLDGETGLFTQNGELTGNIEIWQPPSLLPGENRITVDNSRMDLKFIFRPRFM